MVVPEDRLYSESHLWVKTEGSRATIGLSHHAVEELGEVTYVQLAEPGDSIVKDSPFGMVETSKALTDLPAPISGMVVHANPSVLETPEVFAADPYRAGWLVIVEPSVPEELDLLLNPHQYRELVGSHE
jgi:glycine cleavage system H protein